MKGNISEVKAMIFGDELAFTSTSPSIINPTKIPLIWTVVLTYLFKLTSVAPDKEK